MDYIVLCRKAIRIRRLLTEQNSVLTKLLSHDLKAFLNKWDCDCMCRKNLSHEQNAFQI